MGARGFLKNNGLVELINIIVEQNKFETLADLTLLANNERFLDSLRIPVCWQIKFVNAISKLEQKNDIYDSPPLKSKPGACQNLVVNKPGACHSHVVTKPGASQSPVVTKPGASQSPVVAKSGAYQSPVVTKSGAYQSSITSGTSDEDSPANGQISKKRLVALAKTDLTAQAINLKYNDMNKVLLADLRRAETKLQGAGALKECDSTDWEDAETNMNVVDEIVDSPNVTKFYG